MQIVRQHNLRRAALRAGTLVLGGPCSPETSSSSPLDYDALHPGRRLLLQLPLQPQPPPTGAAGAGCGRFSVAVCDAEYAAAAMPACVVFLVPQGREHEW